MYDLLTKQASDSSSYRAHFFHEDLVMDMFLRPFFLLWIQKEHLSVSCERNVHYMVVTCLLRLARDIVARITVHLDMTLAGDCGCKALSQTNKQLDLLFMLSVKAASI